jgi:tetratricopeptide (TPR) repeat protein
MATSLNELNRQANELKAAGHFDAALALFQRIVDLAPGNAVVLHNLAAALGDAGRHREAVTWARRALEAGLDAPETWLVLARALAAEAGAEAAAEQAADEAEQAFAQVLRRRPADTQAHRDLAQLRWMRSADRGQALAALDEALASQPQAVALHLVRADVLRQIGDSAGAYAQALTALRLGGGAHPQLLLSAANAAFAAGDAEAAWTHAQAAAGADPADPSIAYALCRAWLARGEPRQAEAIAAGLRARFPLDQSYIALQATAWRLLDDPRQAALCDCERLVQGFELACPPGWTAVERYVDDLIEALDLHHRYRTHPFGQSVRQGSQLPSIDRIDAAPLKAVPAAIDGPLRAYLARLGPGDDPLRQRQLGGWRLFSAWSVRLAAGGGHHVNHVHPQGWLSSACHLRFPAPADPQDRSGWLSFGAPGLATRPELPAQRLVQPRKGVMVVFPSYLWHGTLPFGGPLTRLSMAADLLPAAPGGVSVAA